MTADDLLQALRDIDPPPEPAWWLLSPVTVILIGITVTTLLVAWIVYRRRVANRYVAQARRELDWIVAGYRETADQRQLGFGLAAWLLVLTDHEIRLRTRVRAHA